MVDPKVTKELVDKYYDKLSKKEEWGSLLSDEFLFTGTVAKESRGREAYVNNNFFKVIRSLKVKSMLIDGDNTCAVVSYDFISPKGNNFKQMLRKSEDQRRET